MDSTRVLRAIAADTCCGADYEPARRLTFRSRAGKDVARSYLPSPLELYSPTHAEGRTQVRPTRHLNIYSYESCDTGGNLPAGPELKANNRGQSNRRTG